MEINSKIVLESCETNASRLCLSDFKSMDVFCRMSERAPILNSHIQAALFIEKLAFSCQSMFTRIHDTHFRI